MARELKFSEAINEAIDLSMGKDPSVYIIGEGVPDPKGIFGTTSGLLSKYGPTRVMDMPLSEDGMTGMAIGSALVGMRPIMTHQRSDFALLAVNQIINIAAKWHYMFYGQANVPLTIRMMVGRGWGQGAHHSQSLQSLFMHIPGLKVVMPTTPYDAKGLLISSIKDNNPVIFIEHRWLHNTIGHVPEGLYQVPLGKANIIRSGNDITIASTSYMTLEAIKASEFLAKSGIGVEVIDIRTVKPLDEELILQSVKKTGRLIAADLGWRTGGVGAEILARVAENAFNDLKCYMKLISLPDAPTPTSHALTKFYYPRAMQIVQAVQDMLKIERIKDDEESELADKSVPHDVPDSSFTGPF